MIDIIIPIYNTPIEDLERCFKSIVMQTYSNYKVYLIDDGSNNITKEYLDNCVNDNNNFTVKHINNSGVSNARNIGIEISNSPYITFVDGDDTLESDFLEEALNILEENNLDIIIGGYREIKDGSTIRERLSYPGIHIYDNNKINFISKLISGKTNDYNKEIADCPTGRIYTRLFRRDSIGKLRFNTNIKISEDTLFMIDYAFKAKRIGIVDRIWYNYYINSYSISNRTNIDTLKENINDFIEIIENRYKEEENTFIKEAYKERISKATKYLNTLN